MATRSDSPLGNSGFSARLMMGKGPTTIPGSLGHRSPKKLHGMGKTLDAGAIMEDCTESLNGCPQQPSSGNSPPPSKTSNCKDTHSLWKSVQDCHASLTVSNPRHFEFAVANLCFLLKAYGKELDNYVKIDVDKIFQTIRILTLDPSKRPSTRMQLLKVIELRARQWDTDQTREKTKSHCNDNKAAIKPTHKEENEKPIPSCTGTYSALSSPSAPSGMAITITCPAGCVDSSPQSSPQCSPQSTGFWDALTTSSEFHSHLPSIPEETLSGGQFQNPGRADSLHGLACNSLPLIKGDKQDFLMLPLKEALADNGSMCEDTTNTGAVSVRTACNPCDPMLGNTAKAQLPVRSTRSSNQPVQNSREFLLQCWDSPLCRVKPAALQHTIPHSDIYYIIRIPTFADPTSLLDDDTTPPVWGQYQNPIHRRRHFSWPNTMHSSPETAHRPGPE